MSLKEPLSLKLQPTYMMSASLPHFFCNSFLCPLYSSHCMSAFPPLFPLIFIFHLYFFYYTNCQNIKLLQLNFKKGTGGKVSLVNEKVRHPSYMCQKKDKGLHISCINKYDKKFKRKFVM